MAKKESSLKEKKYEISKYMDKRGISSMLQSKVRKYLDYIEHKESESPDRGQQILNEISEKLKQDVLREFYGRIL
jgi:hypothetical protein